MGSSSSGNVAGGMSLAATAVNMFGEYESSRGTAVADTYRAEFQAIGAGRRVREQQAQSGF